MPRFVASPEMGIGTHRSGWPYAVRLLNKLDIPVLFDDVIEWHFEVIKKEPWAGFFHLPPSIEKISKTKSYAQIFRDPFLWKHSDDKLKLVLVMSEHLKRELVKHLTVPIHVVYHPVETPDLLFTEKAYLDNKNKHLHQLGWTFRNMLAIAQIPPLKIMRSWISPITGGGQRNIEWSRKHFNNRIIYDGVRSLNYMNNKEYDIFLSQNVAFMEVSDSSANNAVVDCIIRNTPLIINKNPAVMEYLGVDYPLYFDKIEEVPELVDRALEGHYYLLKKDKSFLSGDTFSKQVQACF